MMVIIHNKYGRNNEEWLVGHYPPGERNFEMIEKFDALDKAAQYLHYLNGGERFDQDTENWRSRFLEVLRNIQATVRNK